MFITNVLLYNFRSPVQCDKRIVQKVTVLEIYNHQSNSQYRKGIHNVTVNSPFIRCLIVYVLIPSI
jgi:hypothetical protein